MSGTWCALLIGYDFCGLLEVLAGLVGSPGSGSARQSLPVVCCSALRRSTQWRVVGDGTHGSCVGSPPIPIMISPGPPSATRSPVRQPWMGRCLQRSAFQCAAVGSLLVGYCSDCSRGGSWARNAAAARRGAAASALPGHAGSRQPASFELATDATECCQGQPQHLEFRPETRPDQTDDA